MDQDLGFDPFGIYVGAVIGAQVFDGPVPIYLGYSGVPPRNPHIRNENLAIRTAPNEVFSSSELVFAARIWPGGEKQRGHCLPNIHHVTMKQP